MLYKEAQAREAIKTASTVRQFIGIQIEAMGIPTGAGNDLWCGLFRSYPKQLERGLKDLDGVGAPKEEIARLKELFVWIAESFPTNFPTSHQFLNDSHVKPFLALGYCIDDIERLDEALVLTLFVRICSDLPKTSYEIQKKLHSLVLENKMEEIFEVLAEAGTSWTPKETIEVTRQVPKWKSDLSYRGHVNSGRRAFTEGFCTGRNGLPLLYDVETGALVNRL